MARRGAILWRSLEKWSAWLFLAAGALILVGTVVVGLQVIAGEETLLKNPFELAPWVGFLVSYLGLLGLYPRLIDRVPRIARTSILLLLLPVVVMVVYVATTVLGVAFPFAAWVSNGAFFLFALGIALFGAGSYRTPGFSSTITVGLLVLSAVWFVFLGAGLVLGHPLPNWIAFVTLAMMTPALLAIGYSLWRRNEPPDRVDTVPDTNRSGR